MPTIAHQCTDPGGTAAFSRFATQRLPNCECPHRATEDGQRKLPLVRRVLLSLVIIRIVVIVGVGNFRALLLQLERRFDERV